MEMYVREYRVCYPGMWKYAQIWTLMDEGTITGLFGDNRTTQGDAEDTELIEVYEIPLR